MARQRDDRAALVRWPTCCEESAHPSRPSASLLAEAAVLWLQGGRPVRAARDSPTGSPPALPDLPHDGRRAAGDRPRPARPPPAADAQRRPSVRPTCSRRTPDARSHRQARSPSRESSTITSPWPPATSARRGGPGRLPPQSAPTGGRVAGRSAGPPRTRRRSRGPPDPPLHRSRPRADEAAAWVAREPRGRCRPCRACSTSGCCWRARVHVPAVELSAAVSGTPVVEEAGALVDQQALTAYRRRVRELDEAIERAEAGDDPDQTGLRAERDQVIADARSGGMTAQRGGDAAPAHADRRTPGDHGRPGAPGAARRRGRPGVTGDDPHGVELPVRTLTVLAGGVAGEQRPPRLPAPRRPLTRHGSGPVCRPTRACPPVGASYDAVHGCR